MKSKGLNRKPGRRLGRTSFDEWIEEKGVDWIAARMGVNRFTVLHWRARRAYPKVEHMKRIKQITRGRVDYTAIIERATPANAHVRGGYRG